MRYGGALSAPSLQDFRPKFYLNATKKCTGLSFLELNINELLSLKCKQKLHCFPEDKTVNEKKVRSAKISPKIA